MSAAIFCPHCKLKYDKAVRLRRHRDFWICSSCAEHYTAETLPRHRPPNPPLHLRRALLPKFWVSGI